MSYSRPHKHSHTHIYFTYINNFNIWMFHQMHREPEFRPNDTQRFCFHRKIFVAASFTRLEKPTWKQRYNKNILYDQHHHKRCAHWYATCVMLERGRRKRKRTTKPTEIKRKQKFFPNIVSLLSFSIIIFDVCLNYENGHNYVILQLQNNVLNLLAFMPTF